jgi:hypothetical protein
MSDERGETILHRWISLSYDEREFNYFILSIISKNLKSEEIFNSLIMKVNDEKMSPLMTLISKRNFEISIWNFIERHTKDQMKELLALLDGWGMSALHYALICHDYETFKLFLDLYEKNFKNVELKKFFILEPNTKHQFEDFLYEPIPQETVEDFLNFLTKIFKDDKKALKDLILQRNVFGCSMFNLRKFNLNHESETEHKAKIKKLIEFTEILKEICSQKEFENLDKTHNFKELYEIRSKLESNNFNSQDFM